MIALSSIFALTSLITRFSSARLTPHFGSS